eukprot:sb/3478913/
MGHPEYNQQKYEYLYCISLQVYQLHLVCMCQQPNESSKQPIRTPYLGHVTGYQPIRDHYFLILGVTCNALRRSSTKALFMLPNTFFFGNGASLNPQD